MPRLATTADVFNAIAEPRRREIIDLLNDGEDWSVNDLVECVNVPQPSVSKHLGVLRKVGIVSVSKSGQHRLYRLEAARLQPVHEWIRQYDRFWTSQIARIKARAEKQSNDDKSHPNR